MKIDWEQKYEEMLVFEKEIWKKNYRFIAGIDEAGRGPLAGPIVAAAVILDPKKPIIGLNDSKKLTEKKREILFDEIKEKAIAFGVSAVDAETIDKIKINEANRKVMREALFLCSPLPDYVLCDFVVLPELPIPQESITKGDEKSVSIAAASILAKVTRDRIMVHYDKIYQGYEFSKHKGYGTKRHRELFDLLGPSLIHRQTFIKKWLNHSKT